MKRRNASSNANGRDQMVLFDELPHPLPPTDQTSREQFIRGVEENFSIIAPAGVGKTQSIVERIVAIARHRNATEWLPCLVVVTFTKRAADEMQQRAREEILRAQVRLDVLEHFNRAFFGTIHSFCVELLRTFGHHIGLPAKFELIEKDDVLWLDFLQESLAPGGMKEDEQQRFCRHTALQKLLRLGRTLNPAAEDDAELALPDELHFEELLAHPATGGGGANIKAAQDLVREWRELFCGDEKFLPLPRFKKGGARFQEIWRTTFAPFREWLCSCALRVAAQTAHQYREFRIRRGLLTYDDQVALASELLRLPSAARQIREREYRVILDEAQDTDVGQFHVLLECARPREADSDWQKSRAHPPAPGRFSMVGDPQQSIYSNRADLARYASIRGLLGRASAGTELQFTTTFRCDEAIIDFVNKTFPRVFTEATQVTFVPLKPRPRAGSGQVVRFQFEIPPELDPKLVDRKRAIIEAEALAKWIVENGLAKLRASSWSEVAILVPQKRWFSPLRIALRNAGIRTQVQSPRDIKGDSPAYAWLTALVMIAADPRNHFEIFGVLRELFGISDDDLAHFSAGKDYVFRIDRETDGSSALVNALNLLARTRREILGQPLRDAVAQLVSATKLRARLAALPREFFDNTASELDDLLALTASAEADGQTLWEFAGTLRQNFSAVRETRPAETDAIQLVTCHKAKGLQWDAVILPFFHRRQYPPRSQFPRLIHRGSELPAIVALEGDDISQETKALVELRERQEMERLLYVSLTRARQTLVLADDAELFQKGGNVHRRSLAGALRVFDFTQQNNGRWLSSSGPNWTEFGSLDTGISAAAAAPSKAAEIKPGDAREQIAAISSDDISRAMQNASEFPKRLLPSSFVGNRSDEKWRLDREPEWREPTPGSGAIAYGRWWHELMQSLPWRDSEARTRLFSEALTNSPDKTRSTHEWELLNASDFVRQIFTGKFIVHSEMPILWHKSNAECVEGVIDLAIFVSDEWLIIDWKTDLVETQRAESLREIYGAQVAAYVEAIRAITQQRARGGLYSTSAGAWLPL
jgi:ATP-dependent exoDNAse (exonuclease V) beta subunit